MIFQVVHPGLLEVAHVAKAQGGAAEREVEGEHLAQRRRAAEGGRHDVVVVVAAAENLVVRLSVVGAERQSHERNAQLIAQRVVVLPQAKAVCGGCRRRYVERQACLRRVVAVACVVEKANVDIGLCAGLDVEAAVEEVPVVVYAVAERVGSGYLAAVARAVVAVGHVALMYYQARPAAVPALAQRV